MISCWSDSKLLELRLPLARRRLNVTAAARSACVCPWRSVETRYQTIQIRSLTMTELPITGGSPSSRAVRYSLEETSERLYQAAKHAIEQHDQNRAPSLFEQDERYIPAFLRVPLIYGCLHPSVNSRLPQSCRDSLSSQLLLLLWNFEPKYLDHSSHTTMSVKNRT